MHQRRQLQRLVALEIFGCLVLVAAFVAAVSQFQIHPLVPATATALATAPSASAAPPATEVVSAVVATADGSLLTTATVAEVAPAATETPAAPGLLVRVSADGDNLRLRKQPGTFGEILGLLKADTPLTAVGRTADSAWLEVDSTSLGHGWVLAEFVTTPASTLTLPVTGVALVPPATYPPYIVGLSPATRAIFLKGQALGNRPDVFSKVGDSITVAPDFLTPIGQGRAVLRDYRYLQPAIDYFSAATARDGNSFLNTSLAAKNGWSAWTVLDANYRDKKLCLPDESPLRCEYRMVKPSLALILLGTNDAVNSTTAAFQANLSTIVQASLEVGVIPVLTTIPERLLGDIPASQVDEFNAVIPEVAQAYGVPLWDYRATLADLPNHGIGDTVHPSSPPNGNAADFSPENLQYGYTVRNLGALEVLNALWRNVMAPP